MAPRLMLGMARRAALLLGLALLGVALVAAPVAAAASTKRISSKANGKQANDTSRTAVASANGRHVAFISSATNLVKNDTNDKADVFVRDLRTRKVRRVSVRSNGAGADGLSFTPSISGSGRFVAFESRATNLVKHDSNATSDIFVHDRKTGKTRRVSVHTSGAQSDEESWLPSISANGRYVAFVSLATNLVNNDTNGQPDVFIHDRKSGKTKLVSVHTNGTQGNGDSDEPDISADGRFIVFDSTASNLALDTNSSRDVFLRDRKTGKTRLVSRRSDGAQVNASSSRPVISGDGRFVVFESDSPQYATNDTNGFADIFMRDRKSGKTKWISVDSAGASGTGSSRNADISASGRYIVFESNSRLVRKDTNGTADIFVRDRVTKKTKRASVRSNGKQANGTSIRPGVSGDGRHVVFESQATNLKKPDLNGTWDVFRRGPLR